MGDLFNPPRPKPLRIYQEIAISKMRESIRCGNRRIVLELPTGAGKTLIAAHIVRSAVKKRQRVLFIAPAIDLINQTVAKFEAEGINDIGVMQGNHPRTNPLAWVQVATVQTLARRKFPSVSLVIVDECHIQSEYVDNLLSEQTDLIFIGLSATPWSKGMARKWQDLIVPTSINALISDGVLSQFRVFAPDIPDLQNIATRAGDYVESELERIMGEAKLVGSVVTTWLEKAEDRPTLVFAVNRAHAAQLKLEFERRNIASAYVDGYTDRIERQIIGTKFETGEIRVICSVRTMTTGVDLRVSCIVDAAPTRSEILHVQKIGRRLRVNPGTEDCLILDHAGNNLRLGLVTDIHHAELNGGKKESTKEAKSRSEKLPKPCIQCGILHTGLICPACRHERKLQARIIVAEGDLVPIKGFSKTPSRADMQRYWSMALWVDDDRGKSGSLALALFKHRFGEWPKHLADMRIEPDRAFRNLELSARIKWLKGKFAERGQR